MFNHAHTTRTHIKWSKQISRDCYSSSSSKTALSYRWQTCTWRIQKERIEWTKNVDGIIFFIQESIAMQEIKSLSSIVDRRRININTEEATMTTRRQQIKYIKTTYSHWMVDHWICKQVQADQIKSSSRRRKFTFNNKHFFNLKPKTKLTK